MYVPRKDYIIEIYRELVQWAHTEMNTLLLPPLLSHEV